MDYKMEQKGGLGRMMAEAVKMEQKEGLERMMAEAVVAILLPQHPSEPGATSPPAQRSLVKKS